MMNRTLAAASLTAAVLLGGCATSADAVLRYADRMERDGQEYSELLMKYAVKETNPEDKAELERDARAVLVETRAAANALRKQVGWNAPTAH